MGGHPDRSIIRRIKSDSLHSRKWYAAKFTPGRSGVLADEQSVRGCREIDNVRALGVHGDEQGVNEAMQFAWQIPLLHNVPPSRTSVVRFVQTALGMAWRARGGQV